MTCAWIDNQIHTTFLQAIAGAFIFSPGIFTDFKTKPDSIDLVDEITDLN